jgi:hypothetical protein
MSLEKAKSNRVDSTSTYNDHLYSIDTHSLSGKSKCALVAFVVGGVAGAVIIALGGLNVFGPIASVGFIASITGGVALTCTALGGMVWIAVLYCKNHKQPAGSERKTFSFQNVANAHVSHSFPLENEIPKDEQLPSKQDEKPSDVSIVEPTIAFKPALNESSANKTLLPEVKEREDIEAEVLEEKAEQFIKDLCAASKNDEWLDNSFNCKYGTLCEKLKITRQQLRTDDAMALEKLRAKVKKWVSQVYSLQKTCVEIVWVTGTRSPMLVGMVSAVKKGLCIKPALVPTGQLAAWNIVPMTGELAWGVTANCVNQAAISGAPFGCCEVAYKYAQNQSFAFNTDTELKFILALEAKSVARWLLRLKIAVLRLIHSGADPSILLQARKHIEESILPKMRPVPTGWETLARLVGEETKNYSTDPANNIEHPLPKGTLVGVKRSDKTIRMAQIYSYDPKKDSYALVVDHEGTRKDAQIDKIQFYNQETLRLQAQKAPQLGNSAFKMIQSIISDDDEHREDIDSILELFESEKKVQLSEKEKTYLDDSFPLIWGLTESVIENRSLNFSRVHSAVPELSYKGVLELGSEIQVAFTKKSKVEELSQWLREQTVSTVRVLSFGAMMYLHANREF